MFSSVKTRVFLAVPAIIIYIVKTRMNKTFLHIFIGVFFLLSVGTMFMIYRSCAQYQLKQEVAVWTERIAVLHELMGERKVLQEQAVLVPDLEELESETLAPLNEIREKIQRVDEQIEQELAAVVEEVAKSGSLTAQLRVLPRIAELYYVKGDQTAALRLLYESEQLIPKVEDLQVRAGIYISYAESNLVCRDYTSYEECRKYAEELVAQDQDSKWRQEMETALKNLTFLANEWHQDPPQSLIFLEQEESIPSEELPLDVTGPHAGAPAIRLLEEELEMSEEEPSLLTLEELGEEQRYSELSPTETPTETPGSSVGAEQ